jgi:hypothetical protein
LARSIACRISKSTLHAAEWCCGSPERKSRQLKWPFHSEPPYHTTYFRTCLSITIFHYLY